MRDKVPHPYVPLLTALRDRAAGVFGISLAKVLNDCGADPEGLLRVMDDDGCIEVEMRHPFGGQASDWYSPARDGTSHIRWHWDRIVGCATQLPDVFDCRIRITQRGRTMLARLEGQTSLNAGPRGAEDLSAQSEVRPMTDGQKRFWDALEGRILTGKKLASELGTSEETVRQWKRELVHAGHRVDNRPGRGYYRPDAPPPDSENQPSK